MPGHTENRDAPPDRPTEWSETRNVYLVGIWEPESYTGPTAWAELARWRAGHGNATPHWMVFPRWCHRIRNAYAAMGNASPTIIALRQLADQVQISLGEDVQVHLASLLEPDALATSLRRDFERGERDITLAPLSLSDEQSAQLRTLVTNTRIRESGAIIRFAPEVDISSWLGNDLSRLERLFSGEPVPTPADPDQALIDSVVSAIWAA